MKKILAFLGLIFLLLSASPYPEQRIIKEYYSVAVLAWDIKEDRLLNMPSIGAEKLKYDDVGIIYIPTTNMKLPLVDVILHDEVYGDTLIPDELMRYILVVSEVHHIEPIFILSMMQVDPVANLSHRDVDKRVRWFYRVRALGGIDEKYILAEYKKLPKEFFK